ncbi:MAG: FkbM family methyltransferase [Bacteroidota bacterium]|nr:FkbM family methyltransferase [Bacteroidota bacterium]
MSVKSLYFIWDKEGKMLKNQIRRILQKVLGFHRYLFLFALFTIRRLPYAKAYADFRYFLALIPDEGTLLDIGANIGVTASILARRFPHSQVLAFEPIPDNLETMQKVVRFQKIQNIQIFATALGDTDGLVNMQVPEINGSRMQGLSLVVENEYDPAYPSGPSYQVPVQMLDHMSAIQTTRKISAIKIDVENYEYFVLSGAKETIRKHQPLLFCELWNNERRNPCIQLMSELGYRCFVLQQKKLVPFEGQDSLNFIFFH